MFQSPIYGSRTSCEHIEQYRKKQFQSPIYGSRTRQKGQEQVKVWGFNPLSTGHALAKMNMGHLFHVVSIPYLRVTHQFGSMNEIRNILGFNPLSTGHAPFARMNRQGELESFNPLSTGHAPNPSLM